MTRDIIKLIKCSFEEPLKKSVKDGNLDQLAREGERCPEQSRPESYILSSSLISSLSSLS